MTVDSGKSYRFSASALYKIYKILIDFSRKNHLCRLDGFLVGDTQSIHKGSFLADF